MTNKYLISTGKTASRPELPPLDPDPTLFKQPLASLDDAKQFLALLWSKDLLFHPGKTALESIGDKVQPSTCEDIQERMWEAGSMFQRSGESFNLHVETLLTVLP